MITVLSSCGVSETSQRSVGAFGVLGGFAFRIGQDLLGPSSQVFGFPPLLAVVIPAGICALAGVWLLRRAG